jgi:hypothetical protein
MYSTCESRRAARRFETLSRKIQRLKGVLMDISLKGEEDGLQITRFLRSQARFRATPIIAVTTHASVEHQRTALEAGCDAVLTKPVKRSQILSALAQARRAAPIPGILH